MKRPGAALLPPGALVPSFERLYRSTTGPERLRVLRRARRRSEGLRTGAGLHCGAVLALPV